MRVTIEVDQIRLGAALYLQQPISSALHVVPCIFHPFQLQTALVDFDVANAARLLALIAGESRAHGREGNGYVMIGQSSG